MSLRCVFLDFCVFLFWVLFPFWALRESFFFLPFLWRLLAFLRLKAVEYALWY